MQKEPKKFKKNAENDGSPCKNNRFQITYRKFPEV